MPVNTYRLCANFYHIIQYCKHTPTNCYRYMPNTVYVKSEFKPHLAKTAEKEKAKKVAFSDTMPIARLGGSTNFPGPCFRKPIVAPFSLDKWTTHTHQVWVVYKLTIVAPRVCLRVQISLSLSFIKPKQLIKQTQNNARYRRKTVKFFFKACILYHNDDDMQWSNVHLKAD